MVLGMHRSGTSAATKLIHDLGVRLGRTDDIIESGPHNSEGFWESLRLIRFNDTLLARLGGSWDRPPPTQNPAASLAHGRCAFDGFAAFLRVYGLSRRPWLWKDPRNCLLVDYWREILRSDVVVVHIFRSPVEVADSLGRRDGLPVSHSLALWERYNRSALTLAEGLPTLVVSYTDALVDPTTTEQALTRLLLDHRILSTANTHLARTSLRPSLRHSVSADSDITGLASLSSNAAELYGFLRSARGFHASLALELPPETPGLQTVFDKTAPQAR